MKTIFFKLFYLSFVVVALSNISLASMTKAYIGSEDGQVILGIESLSTNHDGLLGGEFRTALAKRGIEVNGMEYGYLPTKLQLSLIVGGGDALSVASLKNTFTYIHSEPIKFHRNSEVKVISGQGPYLLYQ